VVIPWAKYFHAEPTKWTFLAVLLLAIAFWIAFYFCYVTSAIYQQFILFSSLCIIPAAFAIPICYPLWYILQGRRDAARIKKLKSGGYIVRWEIPLDEFKARTNMEMAQAQEYWKKNWGSEFQRTLKSPGMILYFILTVLAIIGQLIYLFSFPIPPSWLATILLGVVFVAIFNRTRPLWLPMARVVLGERQVLYIGEDGIYQSGYGLLPFAEGRTRLYRVLPYEPEAEGMFLGFQFVQKRLLGNSYYDFTTEYILKTPNDRTEEAVACAEELNQFIAIAPQKENPLKYDDRFPRNYWGTPIDGDRHVS
jgi:hypothetical protein